MNNSKETKPPRLPLKTHFNPSTLVPGSTSQVNSTALYFLQLTRLEAAKAATAQCSTVPIRFSSNGINMSAGGLVKHAEHFGSGPTGEQGGAH